MSKARMPSLFVCHGAGPSFFVDWPFGKPDAWHPMRDWLVGLLDTLPQRPTRVLVVSGHHVEARATVTTSPRPAQLDLAELAEFPGGTPDLTHTISGDTALAEDVRDLLAEAKIDAAADGSRGLDHGVWMPLKLADAEATLPVVSLSLVQGFDPELHLRIGRALTPLRERGVLILGSGASFHNMGLVRRAQSLSEKEIATALEATNAFDAWLEATVALPDAERRLAFAAWRDAPGASSAHDTADHFIPLLVAAGAGAENRGAVMYRDRPVAGLAQSMFRFG